MKENGKLSQIPAQGSMGPSYRKFCGLLRYRNVFWLAVPLLRINTGPLCHHKAPSPVAMTSYAYVTRYVVSNRYFDSLVTWTGRFTGQKVDPDQGRGILSQFPRDSIFSLFLESSKHLLLIEYHIHDWQVSPELCCGGTCPTWMWFK